jgi:hypothetical protein
MKRIITSSLAFCFCLGFSVVILQSTSASDTKNRGTTVTFNKDVAPIVYRNCASCHRPGELAPMSLLSYKDARPWARSIKEKVVTRQMPPWHADPLYGHFINEARLTQQEIDTITAWVDGGAKEGSPKDLPPAPRFIEGWKLGKPDVVFTMNEEYTIAASGSDEYINFTMPTSFKEDVWVQAAEINPGNRRVVHHVVAFIQTPQMIAQGGQKPPGAGSIFYQDGTLVRVKQDAPVYDDSCNSPTAGFARGSGQEGLGFPLCFYTPGKDVDVYPEGVAKLIPKGSNIVIQVHYSKTTGRVEKDRSSVGLTLAKARPEKAVTSFGVLNHYFKIPPGADNHEVRGCYTFSRDVELFTYLPHMHVRGKDMKYEVVYPDGRRETLLWVPRYDFNWQTMYRLQKPLQLPKGSKMIVTAHFDNSEKNKNNPDPTKAVRFGDPTYDEMMVGYFDFVNKTRKVVKLDPKVYDSYAGEYSVGPVSFTITRDGDKLMFSAPGQPMIEAYPESETRFYFTVVDGQVTFLRKENGEVTELVFEINGRSIRANRIKKVAPANEQKVN